MSEFAMWVVSIGCAVGAVVVAAWPLPKRRGVSRVLILTRKVNEKVVIGEITVTVVDVGGGRVRLGIDAPPGVPVVRSELSPIYDPPARPVATPPAGG